MLRGQKVLLRPVMKADFGYFLKWFDDPEVTQYLELDLPMTEKACEEFVEDLTDSNGAVFMIEPVEGNLSKCIGSCMLDHVNPKDQTAEFAIVIGEREHWSKGYGSEAARLLIAYGFEELNLRRINSAVIGLNERSIRMHKRIGFREEGRRREAVFKNGKFQDDVAFGLLRAEWKGL